MLSQMTPDTTVSTEWKLNFGETQFFKRVKWEIWTEKKFKISFTLAQRWWLHNKTTHLKLYAAAKSLQSCPTLCDSTDSSPPGSPVPGILQARTPEWVAISFSNAWKWKVQVKSLGHAWLLATPWTAAYQAPPSMQILPIGQKRGETLTHSLLQSELVPC